MCDVADVGVRRAQEEIGSHFRHDFRARSGWVLVAEENVDFRIHVENQTRARDDVSRKQLRLYQLYSRTSGKHIQVLGRRISARGEDGDNAGEGIGSFELLAPSHGQALGSCSVLGPGKTGSVDFAFRGAGLWGPPPHPALTLWSFGSGAEEGWAPTSGSLGIPTHRPLPQEGEVKRRPSLPAFGVRSVTNSPRKGTDMEEK
ncbi:hypothetical protein J1605_016903 [Eschrichtius robustus]|uniref:Fibroblast growth factor 18 n=1 Tax=Eschrichtius robustus TaxID=9764 RepID=A0AB34I511_ESCRO|nr:hypothetical protein J1605_016903 [Eschrichtius robustus]